MILLNEANLVQPELENDEEMLVDFFEDEVVRKPDIVKKQRLMDAQYDYFDFQAKKNSMAKNVPVR